MIDTALRSPDLVLESAPPELSQTVSKNKLRKQFRSQPKRCFFCGAPLPVPSFPHLVLVFEDSVVNLEVLSCPACAKREVMRLRYVGKFYVPEETGRARERAKRKKRQAR